MALTLSCRRSPHRRRLRLDLLAGALLELLSAVPLWSHDLSAPLAAVPASSGSSPVVMSSAPWCFGRRPRVSALLAITARLSSPRASFHCLPPPVRLPVVCSSPCAVILASSSGVRALASAAVYATLAAVAVLPHPCSPSRFVRRRRSSDRRAPSCRPSLLLLRGSGHSAASFTSALTRLK